VGAFYDDLPGHEGYATRSAPEGDGGPIYSPFTYVAACTCGWTGGSHPPAEAGYEAALGDWDRRHAIPLLAEAVPPAVSDAIGAAQRAVADLTRERPAAGIKTLLSMASWAESALMRLPGPATERPATRPLPRRPRRL
jgi:hypothetical protein